jgi:hypothetical protein
MGHLAGPPSPGTMQVLVGRSRVVKVEKSDLFQFIVTADS